LYKTGSRYFYADITDALRLFIDCREFSIAHDELTSAQPSRVIEKDGWRINLFENEALTKEHNPEFMLVTNDCDEVYKKISASHPQLLHPQSKITLDPWGAKEFALMDKQPGIIIQQ